MLGVQALSRAGEHSTAPDEWQELLWGLRTLCCLFQCRSPPPLCSPLVFKYRWFYVVKTTRGKFWIFLLVSPLPSGLARKDQSRSFSFLFIHLFISYLSTYLLNTVRGDLPAAKSICRYTVLAHVWTSWEIAWFKWFPSQRRTQYAQDKLKTVGSCSASRCFPAALLEACQSWGASRPAGWQRCLLYMLEAAQVSLTASPSSHSHHASASRGWDRAGASPWGTEACSGDRRAGMEGRGQKPGESPAAQHAALSKWQKHAQSDNSPAWSRKVPYVMGQFVL